MRRYPITALVVVAAVATLFVPSAEAKFDISFTFEPAQPIARQRVGVTMRTGVVLPTKQSMRLIAVGPWREDVGQTVLDVPFARIGRQAFRARFRFPHPGTWRLTVLNTGAPGSVPLPPADRQVAVRPRR